VYQKLNLFQQDNEDSIASTVFEKKIQLGVVVLLASVKPLFVL
jgi:hypothetical protein